eukprot:126986-Chlamydomonas_euryale.AAC.4
MRRISVSLCTCTAACSAVSGDGVKHGDGPWRGGEGRQKGREQRNESGGRLLTTSVTSLYPALSP